MKPEEQDRSSQARAAPPIWRGFVPRDPGAGSGLGALRHRAEELAERSGKPPCLQTRESAVSRWAAQSFQPRALPGQPFSSVAGTRVTMATAPAPNSLSI